MRAEVERRITPPPIFYRLAYTALRIYWWVFRPEVRGVRCVVEHEDRILLIRHTYDDGRWTFPGGGLRRAEPDEQAARREVAEEVGIELGPLEFIGRYVSDEKRMRDDVRCFRGRAQAATLRLHRGEVREARWFSPASMPADLSNDARRVIALYDRAARPPARPAAH
jgi:8-oxo-dGTP pyrophosphatase MutT (NUDIX family)